jgi:acyl-CoA synthetase (AMP-forming)/AMP-acid ligase II
VGEILVRSDSMLSGYMGRPDLTSQAVVDGWYRTRDLGFLDGGELYVTGRKDDLIIVGGKNLSPQDIEEIASAHPDVRDGRVAAFGVVNPDLGTRDLVVLAEAKDAAGLEQRERVEADLRRRVLAEIGVAPKQVMFLPPRWLVKSSAGKIARSTNRAKFLREFPELGYEEANANESGRSREPGE